MSTQGKLFRPQLRNARPLNGHEGETFRCFSRGDTLAFQFEFIAEDGLPVDVTDWTVTVAFSNKLYEKDCGEDQRATQIEVDIPISDLANAIFSGEVTPAQTESLLPGINYAQVIYTVAAAESYILDMAIIEVYPSIICSQD